MIYPFLIIGTIIIVYYYRFDLFNYEIKCSNKKCNKVFIYSKINDDYGNNYCCNMDCVIEAYHQEKIKNKQYVIFED
jgi:hypothetical protein